MRTPTSTEIHEVRMGLGCDYEYARKVCIKQQIRDELEDPAADVRVTLLWLVTELL